MTAVTDEIMEYFDTVPVPSMPVPKPVPEEAKQPEQPGRPDRSGEVLLVAEGALRGLETEAVRLRTLMLDISGSSLVDAVDEKNLSYGKRTARAEAAIQGVGVEHKDGVLEIRIPGLLPHRKEKPDVLFQNALESALADFRETKGFPKFRKGLADGAVLAVRHCYKTPWMVRDNDNVETKCLIDCIVRAGLIPTDAGTHLDFFQYTGTCGECGENHTDCFLMPRDGFVQFLAAAGF